MDRNLPEMDKMDDSDLAIEQALQRLDSESSDSEVNAGCLTEPGSESCSVVDGADLQLEDSMFSNDQAMAILRRFVMNGGVNRGKVNSLQNSVPASKDNSSVASFSTDSDGGAKSDLYCPPRRHHVKSRMAVSDTEGSRPRKRIHNGAYLTEHKYVSKEEFFLTLRERLLAVSKDRDAMTHKARNLLRQNGKTYDEIMSAQWYDLPEACKYLQGSDLPPNAVGPVSHGGNGTLQPPSSSSHHPLSPLEVHSPTSTPGLRVEPGGMRDVEEAMREWRVSTQRQKRHSHQRQTTSACSSVFSANSDSGVGDTWGAASSELTTPTNDRLHAYIHRQNSMAARQPERERMAHSAAVALISNSPHPESLNPLPGPTHQHHHHDNDRHRRHNLGHHHYSSGDDSSSAFSQSSTSDLFIPKRPPHYGPDSDDQQHYMNRYPRRPLSTPRRSNHIKNSHTPSPLTEQHRQQLPAQQTQRPAPHSNKGDTLIIYTLDDLPTPFAKRLGGGEITLKDFKERVFLRKGEYRFFFKCFNVDVSMELLEEYCDDMTVLPLVNGKIEGRVEKITVD